VIAEQQLDDPRGLRQELCLPSCWYVLVKIPCLVHQKVEADWIIHFGPHFAGVRSVRCNINVNKPPCMMSVTITIHLYQQSQERSGPSISPPATCVRTWCNDRRGWPVRHRFGSESPGNRPRCGHTPYILLRVQMQLSASPSDAVVYPNDAE
jgi:hypothetical protein